MTVYNRISRDPAGFAFSTRNSTLVQVNRAYSDIYDHLANSGALRELAEAGLMAVYRESGLKYARTEDAYRVLRQQTFPHLLTYPYEWPFSAWKAGALCVLATAEAALTYGVTLRRAGPLSVSFDGTNPRWTDPLAFTFYEDGVRWPGYTQFVREWLGPLALMSQVDVRLGVMARSYPDGLPLETVSVMLPVRTRMNLGLSAHIHLGGRDFFGGRADVNAVRETLRGLRETVEGVRWSPEREAPFTDYAATPQDQIAEDHRRALVRGYVHKAEPTTVWDMATGDGAFARIAGELAPNVVAFEPDPVQAERLWLAASADDALCFLPVWQDWANPSPNLGWGYRELRSSGGRGTPDLLLALGWVHRLVLAKGISLADIAATLARLAPYAIVEFLPTTDPGVIALLPRDAQVDEVYTQDLLEAAFAPHYETVYADTVEHTERTIYLFRRRSQDE
jgi:hypothetical protein